MARRRLKVGARGGAYFPSLLMQTSSPYSVFSKSPHAAVRVGMEKGSVRLPHLTSNISLHLTSHWVIIIRGWACSWNFFLSGEPWFLVVHSPISSRPGIIFDSLLDMFQRQVGEDLQKVRLNFAMFFPLLVESCQIQSSSFSIIWS